MANIYVIWSRQKHFWHKKNHKLLGELKSILIYQQKELPRNQTQDGVELLQENISNED